MPRANKFNANEHQIKFTSPRGEAMWACLKTPKVWKEGDKGNYQISLSVSMDDGQDLIQQCTDMKNKMAELLYGSGDVRYSPYEPWKEVDGKIEFRFKKPHFPANDKYPASRPIPTYLDGDKVDWDNVDWAIGNGSIVTIGGFVRPYDVPTMGLGISLRLAAVKIHKLEKYTGGSDDFGFSEDTSNKKEEEFSDADF